LNDQLSSSEYGEEAQSEDSEVLEYEPEIPKIKYKLISIAASDCAPDKWKVIKYECKKTKPLNLLLIEMVSKKQVPMMFQTNQTQHLIGAAREQIEE
jgi:hypothetical protein